MLEREMERLEAHHRVPDRSVTMRNGRYVIPVRREARVVAGGIVHDTSASGATLFVEPPAAVEFGNRMRELESEEIEEVERILLELTDELRPQRDEMIATLDALVELDSLYARARFGAQYACAPATLVPARDGFDIRNGRHPLLLAQGADVVPFDLDDGRRRAHAARLRPEHRRQDGSAQGARPHLGARRRRAFRRRSVRRAASPIFDDAFADVGDEQSIEASLSTFSAHLKNLAEILRLATADSLVLIDELGSGTDPVEGAALGWAILEELTARGTMTVATTHLGTLKELATQVAGVVNASLQFDAVALAPTYRLIKGIPGRSYGISIARRLQLPDDVVARAEERLPQQERDVAALIEQLEAREEELETRERESDRDPRRRASPHRRRREARAHRARARARRREDVATGRAALSARRARRDRPHDQGSQGARRRASRRSRARSAPARRGARGEAERRARAPRARGGERPASCRGRRRVAIERADRPGRRGRSRDARRQARPRDRAPRRRRRRRRWRDQADGAAKGARRGRSKRRRRKRPSPGQAISPRCTFPRRSICAACDRTRRRRW